VYSRAPPSIRRVSSRLFWLSLGVQVAAVAAFSGVLIALPLSDDFFEDWGFLVGPLAWIGCSLVTARVLSLPVGYVLFAALAGGVAGTIVLLVTSHWPGVAAGLLVFAASCGSYQPEAEGETA
jgi:predicted anti-sigma-YlaC factor YlaD